MSSRRAFLQAAAAAPLAAMPQTPPSDVTELSASRLSDAIHAKTVSCREVMQAYLERIRRWNKVHNAVVSMLPDDQALRLADQADRELAEGKIARLDARLSPRGQRSCEC